MIHPLANRLRNRLTWLRYTFPFQLAHGPLCTRHRGNALRIGRVYLCRSCACLYGALAILVPLLLWAGPGPVAWGWMLGLAAPAVLLLSWPPVYARLGRSARDFVRAGAGGLAALVLVGGIQGFHAPAIGAAAGLALAYVVFARKRRSERASLCAGCPELELRGSRVCSGFRRQAVYLRRHEEVVSARQSAAVGARLAGRARGVPTSRP